MLKSKKSKVKRQKYSGYRILACGLMFVVCSIIFYIFSFAQEEFVYDSQGKHDPFIPLVTPDGRFQKLESDETTKSLELNIEGIIYDKYGISYAIVNDTVVKTGDFVDDYQVLKIKQRKVVFIKEGQIKEVEFKKEEK
jgi:hypothetical protein